MFKNMKTIDWRILMSIVLGALFLISPVQILQQASFSSTHPSMDSGIQARSWTLTHSWQDTLPFQSVGVKLANMDGKLGDEIITAGGNQIVIYNGSASSWTKAATLSIPTGYNISAFDIGDLDGDSDMDIALAANQLPGSNRNPLWIMTFMNQGNFNFTLNDDAHKIPSAWYGGLSQLIVGDVDHQSGDDIIISVSIDSRNLIGQSYKNNPDKVSIYQLLNAGDGTNFTRSEIKSYITDYSSGYIFSRLYFGNLNGDSYDDLVVSASGFNSVNPPNNPRYYSVVEAFMNNGGAILSQSAWNYTLGGPIVYSLGEANIDNDLYNRPDLLIGTDYDKEGDQAWNDGYLWIFSGNGDCTFSNTVFQSKEIVGLGPVRNILTGDFDTNDGDDVFISFWYGTSEYAANLLSNDGTGGFNTVWSDTSANTLQGDMRYVAGADINHDSAGLQDVIYTGQNNINILSNTYVDDDAPPAVPSQVVYDTPNDEGGSLTIEWGSYSVSDFAKYNIYISDSMFSDVSSMTPEKSITDMSVRKAVISTMGGQPLQNGVYYHLAVTAVDNAGNENTAVSSIAAAPEDNLPPPKLSGLTAADTPNDNGGSITVSWEESSAADFDHYNIYIRYANPITSLNGLKPEVQVNDKSTVTTTVTTVNMNKLLDDVDYYIAAAAVDVNGNLNRDDFATAGPVQPHDNIAPEAVNITSFEDKPDDTGGVLELKWSPIHDETFKEYRIYLSDKSFTSLSDKSIELVSSIELEAVTEFEVTTYHDNPLINGHTYYAAVIAVDRAGNMISSGLTPAHAVPHDNIPPARVEGITITDKAGDDKGAVIVSWNPSLEDDLDHYNVYVSQVKIYDIHGLTPDAQTYGRYNTTVEVSTTSGLPMECGHTYFFIVTAVDVDGNELREGLNPVSGTPIDDVPPAKIEGLKAIDNPDDAGKKIYVSWSKSTDNNFDHYSIYVSTAKITNLDAPDVKLVKTISDRDKTSFIVKSMGPGETLQNGREYYIVVTAVDTGGFENKLDFAQVGPVEPLNNIPPKLERAIPSDSSPQMNVNEKKDFYVSVQPNSDVTPKYKWYLNGKEIGGAQSASYTYIAPESMAGKTVNLTVVVSTENDLSVARTWNIHISEQTFISRAAGSSNSWIYILIIVILVLIILGFVFAWKKGMLDRFRERPAEKETIEAEVETKENKEKAVSGAVKKSTPLLPQGKGGNKYPALMPPPRRPARSALPPPAYQKYQKGRTPVVNRRALPPTTVRGSQSSQKSQSQKYGYGIGQYDSVKNYLPPVTGEMPDEVGLRTAVNKNSSKKVTPPKCPVCGRPTKGNEQRCAFCGEKFW